MEQHYLRTPEAWLNATQHHPHFLPWHVQRLQEEKMLLLLESYAPGTQKAYGAGWRFWERFMRAQGKDPVLRGATGEQNRVDEEDLMDYIVNVTSVRGRTGDTARQHLFRVRSHHVV